MTNLTQQTPEWVEFRKKHIGSSDIAAVAGLSPWKSAHDLWMEKTGKKEPEPANEAMIWGLEHEREARVAFETKYNIPMMPKVITSKENDFCSASLDGISFEGKSILEIKCPKSATTLTKAIKGEIEPNYMAQIQWQLMLSNANLCYFWVYHPVLGSAMIKVKPDKIMQVNLLETAKIFWDMVLTNTEPENTEGYILIDTPEFLTKAKEYKEIAEMITALEGRKGLLKKELLDETDGGNVKGGGVSITWIYPEDKIDWEAAWADLGLGREELKKFMVPRKPYAQVTISKKAGS